MPEFGVKTKNNLYNLKCGLKGEYNCSTMCDKEDDLSEVTAVWRNQSSKFQLNDIAGRLQSCL